MEFFLPIFLGVCLVGGIAGVVITYKVRQFSRTFFGTDTITEGINRQLDDAATTRKSVNSMTKLMEPQIVRDFPDFVWEEFKHKAENMLISAFNSITKKDVNVLVNASLDIQNQIRNIIEMNEAANYNEVYKDIRIHQTEISNYRKENGKCIITIQSALEYMHYKLDGERVIEGDRERKKQTKYNMELMYIQNADLVKFDNAVSTKCPNCGAPVKNLGQKFCEYCGSGIVEINVKVWSLHKYYEVDYNHI